MGLGGLGAARWFFWGARVRMKNQEGLGFKA